MGLKVPARVVGVVETATTLKVLTVQQPYAEAIMQGLKAREYRSWPTSHRGTLLIHAGKARPCKEGLQCYGIAREGLALGAIVGAVDVTGMVWDRDHECWAWVLASPRRFQVPVPCTGQLGIWRLPPGLAEQVEKLLRS